MIMSTGENIQSAYAKMEADKRKETSLKMLGNTLSSMWEMLQNKPANVSSNDLEISKKKAEATQANTEVRVSQILLRQKRAAQAKQSELSRFVSGTGTIPPDVANAYKAQICLSLAECQAASATYMQQQAYISTLNQLSDVRVAENECAMAIARNHTAFNQQAANMFNTLVNYAVPYLL